MEKASFLLENLRFGRNKKVFVVKKDKSPTNSEKFHSFENIDLDETDKVSIGSADLSIGEQSSESGESQDEMREAKARKKPRVTELNLKSMLKSFLAPEENPSA